MRRRTCADIVVLASVLVLIAVGASVGAAPVVESKNENLKVTLGGRIHRMIQIVDDDLGITTLFTDAEQGPTILKVAAKSEPGDALSLGATLEVAVQQNRPFKVSQDQVEGGIDITGRIAEIFMDADKAGKFSLGRGFAAGWLAPEIDLSMTQFAALLPVGMLSPGLKFADCYADTLTSIQVLTHFIDVERLLIQDRFRYDSHTVSGLRLSGTIAADERWDLALRSRHTPGDFTVAGGTSYQHKPFEGIDRRWDIGISVRHEPTGLSVTAGYSAEELTRSSDATTWVAKLGWLADLVEMGKTAFAADYYQSHDIRLDGDEGISYGVVAMQKWPAYGLDFYAGVRRYEVKRPDIDLKPLLVVPFGVVLTF